MRWPHRLMFEYLVSSGWNCLRKIRRHSLVWCSVSPGQALWFQNTSAIQVSRLGWPSCQLQTPFHRYFLHLFLLSSDIFSNCIFFCLFVCFLSLFHHILTQNLGFQIQVFQSHFFSLVFRTTFFLVFYLIFSHTIYWSYSSPSLSPPHFPSHTTSYSHSLSETKGRKMKNKQNLVRHKYQNKKITKSPTK